MSILDFLNGKNNETTNSLAVAVTKDNFVSEVLESDKTVILDFWASWCGPCKMVAPVLEKIATDRSDVKVCKVNVDEQPELATQFGIMSIPTLIIYKSGQITNKAIGYMPEAEILKLL